MVQRSSRALLYVLSITATAPMRVMENHPTTQSGLFGASRPTWLPLPTPEASSPFASRAERSSTSAYETRWSSSTRKVLSPNRSADERVSSPLVGRYGGNDGDRV